MPAGEVNTICTNLKWVHMVLNRSNLAGTAREDWGSSPASLEKQGSLACQARGLVFIQWTAEGFQRFLSRGEVVLRTAAQRAVGGNDDDWTQP